MSHRAAVPSRRRRNSPGPPAVRAIDGLSVGPLRIVIPRTVGDLVRWSRLLANCFDDYRPAAATGRGAIIGIEHQNALRYALELNPPTASGSPRNHLTDRDLFGAPLSRARSDIRAVRSSSSAT